MKHQHTNYMHSITSSPLQTMLTRHQTRLLTRLYSTKKSDHIGALTQRFKDLEAQYPSRDDALLGDDFKSLIDKDPRLAKLSKRLDQKKFEHENQVAIQATKIPRYADRTARETAHSAPWMGKEHVHDTSLRMLVDKHRPSRSLKEAQKLGRVRDRVLDFQVNKPDEKTPNDEDKQFRKIYTEKFTPIGSFDKIMTLADARIEEAMRRGDFKDIPRGKKLDTEIGPYVDRTEHHLNNILVKQNLAPPWIEKQGGVNAEINGIRGDIADKWRSHVTHFYKEDHDAMKRDFEKRWVDIFEQRVKVVNSSIRTYNLQAPMSAQKFYLFRDKEIGKVHEEHSVESIREGLAREARVMEAEEMSERQANFGSRLERLKFWKW